MNKNESPDVRKPPTCGCRQLHEFLIKCESAPLSLIRDCYPPPRFESYCDECYTLTILDIKAANSLMGDPISDRVYTSLIAIAIILHRCIKNVCREIGVFTSF